MEPQPQRFDDPALPEQPTEPTFPSLPREKRRGFAVLMDPWQPAHPIPLDGKVEIQRFPPVLMAALVAFFGMLAFQILGTIFAFVFAFATGVLTVESVADPEGLQSLMESNIGVMLLGNTAAQFLVLFALGWLAMRLHSSQPRPLLRLRPADAGLIGLSVLGLLVLMPLVSWLGEINNLLPVPEWLREMSEVSAGVIERAISDELSWVAAILMLAVTPAICEEIFFRGYVQRNVERSLGAVWGIVLTGCFFGMFHLNPLQVVPLSLLGIYMGYVVWRTGSLWAGVAAHFANNGAAVTLGKLSNTQPDPASAAVPEASMPWYLVLLSVALSIVVIGVLHRRGAQKLAERAAEVPPENLTPYPEVAPNEA